MGLRQLNGEDTPPKSTMTLSPGDSGLWNPLSPAWQLLSIHFLPHSSLLGMEAWSLEWG